MTTSTMNSSKKVYAKFVNINFGRMILFGSAEVVKLMRHASCAMTASKTLLMKDMKSTFIIHKLEGVVIVVMVAHGSQKDFVRSMDRQLRIPSSELLIKFNSLLSYCFMRFRTIFFVIASNPSRLTISILFPSLRMNFIRFVFTMMMSTPYLRSSLLLERSESFFEVF
jgi:hypothetical protein